MKNKLTLLLIVFFSCCLYANAKNPWGTDPKAWLLEYNECTFGNLFRANLTGANLFGANLFEADLRWAYLTANLTAAYLYDAKLNGADLSWANLTDVCLDWARLRGAILTKADLRRARLYYADLTGADLTGANLTGAYLDDANLTEANLTGARLPGTLFYNTTMPDGTKYTGWGQNWKGPRTAGKVAHPAPQPDTPRLLEEPTGEVGPELDSIDAEQTAIQEWMIYQ